MRFRVRLIRLRVGLSGTGKSTLLAQLVGEPLCQVEPTTGFNIKTLPFKDTILSIKELGGSNNIQVGRIWLLTKKHIEERDPVHICFAGLLGPLFQRQARHPVCRERSSSRIGTGSVETGARVGALRFAIDEQTVSDGWHTFRRERCQNGRRTRKVLLDHNAEPQVGRDVLFSSRSDADSNRARVAY